MPDGGTIHFFPIVKHFSSRRRIKPQQGTSYRCLAAAGFSHHSQSFTGLDGKGYTIYSLQRNRFHNTDFYRKILFQVIDLNKIFAFLRFCLFTHVFRLLALPPSLLSHSASRMRNVRQASAFPEELLLYRFSWRFHTAGRKHSLWAYSAG